MKETTTRDAASKSISRDDNAKNSFSPRVALAASAHSNFGNPEMIEIMVKILVKQGFSEHTKKSPGQIPVERYW